MLWRLYHAGLVRRLKRGARRRVRESGRKSAKGRWWRNPTKGGGSLWWLLILLNAGRAGSLGGVANKQLIEMLLASMSLFLIGFGTSKAAKLGQLLSVGDQRTILLFYPIEDRQSFSWITRRFAAGLLWVIVACGAIAFVALNAGGWSQWVTVLATGIAEWLIVLCIAFGLVRYTDHYPRWTPLALYCAGIILFFSPERLVATLKPLAWGVPTGWLPWVIASGQLSRQAPWIAIATMIGACVLYWWLWSRIASAYGAGMARMQEAEIEPMNDAEPTPGENLAKRTLPAEEELEGPEANFGEATLPMNAAWQKQRIHNLGSKVAEAVSKGEWRRGWNWSQLPPVERMSGWILNEREKDLAQFLLGSRVPNWSARSKVAVIATATAFAAGLPGIPELNMAAAVAFAVSMAAGLPLLGGTWPATGQGVISGKFAPILACFPAGYWRMSLTMWKLNLVRILAWSPLGVMLGALGARSAQMSPGQGCWIASKIILLLVGVMPVLIAGQFSRVTNDTVNLRLRAVLLVVGALLMLAVVGTLGVMAIIWNEWWTIAHVLGVAAVCVIVWWAYGVYYDRGHVDLLRETK